MTFLRRICLAALIVSLGVAGSASAQNTYSLGASSGAQLHIGNGLALPIQPAATALVTGQVLPPLLIPPASGATVMGTAGGNITVPAGVLQKSAAQTTVGVFQSNPTLYAVATNLSYSWPAAPAVFGAAGNPALNIVFTSPNSAEVGNTIVFRERVVGKRFGGAGAFALTPGASDGLISGSAITIYAIAGGANPPCTHTSLTPVTFPGPGVNNCRALLIAALPTGVFAAGNAGPFAVNTPGGTAATGGPNPGVVFGKFGVIGTVTSAVIQPSPSPLRNTAMSDGFQLTTARITIGASGAGGGASPEVFVISGDDARTAGGAGTIQMVAGAMSARTLSGPNANRAWVKLDLVFVRGTPMMSPLAQGIVVLLLIAVPVVYFGKQRRSEAV